MCLAAARAGFNEIQFVSAVTLMCVNMLVH